MKWREVISNEKNQLAIVVSFLIYVFAMGIYVMAELPERIYLGVIIGIFFSIIITFMLAENKRHTLPLAMFLPLVIIYGFTYLVEPTLIIGILGVIGIFVIGEIVFFLDKEKPKKFRMAWVYKDTKKELKFWDRVEVWFNGPTTEKKPKEKRKSAKDRFIDWLEEDDDGW